MKKSFIIVIIILLSTPIFGQTLEWYIDAEYSDIVSIGNNLFKVKNTSGKWGVIDNNGRLSVDMQYDSITHLVENRALLLDISGQYLKGIINESGQIIKLFNNYERLANYQYYNDGLLAYGIVAGSYYLFGYLDLNGNVAIEPKYFWAAPFINGKAVVQYKSKNYGIIDKSGVTVLNDNRKLKFISSPVDDKLLLVVGSNRGDKVVLVRLESSGRLVDITDLEGGTIVKNSNDYRQISCQNGHKYFFDDALRLISSSSGKVYNSKYVPNIAIPSTIAFRREKAYNGWIILHNNQVLLQTQFKEVSFSGDDYVIVKTVRNKYGVLKLNRYGDVHVLSVPSDVVFYHNSKTTGNILINVNDLLPKTKVQIGIAGLETNEVLYDIPSGYNGTYNQLISYFIPSSRYNVDLKSTITINIYIDGMLYKSGIYDLTAKHQRGYVISEAESPAYSNPNGGAEIQFSVRSLNGTPSSTAVVKVNGVAVMERRFNGTDVLYFKIPVTVPYESTQTYTFKITVDEKDCPSYSKTISRTISHYDLQ